VFALCSDPTPTRPGRVYPHDRPDPFEERLQVSYMIEELFVRSTNCTHVHVQRYMTREKKTGNVGEYYKVYQYSIVIYPQLIISAHDG
jgi:hypothetical protein